MERIDGVLGNVHADEELARAREEHEENGTLERVVVDETERKRSRLRVRTDAGTDLGIVVDRPALSGGDVLLLEDDRMIVVTLEPRDAIAVSLPEPAPDAMALAVELGHHVGNQHWDLAVSHGVVYVPLEADRHIVERVIRDVLPDADPQAVTVDAEVFVAGGGGNAGGERGHSHGGGHSHHHHDHGGDQHDHTHEHDDHQHSHGEHDHSHDGHQHDHSDDHRHSHEFTYGDDEDEP